MPASAARAGHVGAVGRGGRDLDRVDAAGAEGEVAVDRDGADRVAGRQRAAVTVDGSVPVPPTKAPLFTVATTTSDRAVHDQRAGVDRGGAGVGVVGRQRGGAGADLVERAGAGDHAVVLVGVGAVEGERGVVDHVAEDRAGGAAVAELQDAGVDGGEAGVGVVAAQDRRAGADLGERAAAPKISGMVSLRRRSRRRSRCRVLSEPKVSSFSPEIVRHPRSSRPWCRRSAAGRRWRRRPLLVIAALPPEAVSKKAMLPPAALVMVAFAAVLLPVKKTSPRVVDDRACGAARGLEGSWPVLVKVAVPAVLELEREGGVVGDLRRAGRGGLGELDEVVVHDGGGAGRAGIEEPRQRIGAGGDGGVAGVGGAREIQRPLLVMAMLPAVVPVRNSVSPLLRIDVMPETSAFTIVNVAGRAATVTGPASAPACRACRAAACRR